MICEKLLERKNSQYVGYINNIISLFDANGLSKTFNHLDDAFKLDKGKTIDFLKNVSTILRKLKSSRGFSFKLDKKLLEVHSIESYRSGLNSYIQILEQNVPDSCGPKKWMKKFGEEFKTVYALAHQIDGTESLLNLIEDHDKEGHLKFVKSVLKESFFFAPEDVKEQFEDIKQKYEKRKKIFARWTEWYNSKKELTSPFPGKKKDDIIALSQEKNKKAVEYLIENVKKKVPVHIDEDGNKNVRDLIEDKTGYLVSAGEKSTFIFYKISHIWGKAYDPRYFTNLWNIVLVPAWANDLLDKGNSKDELTNLFQQVIKKVCIKYYKMRSLQWNDIDMACPSYKSEGEEDYIEKYRVSKESIDIKIRIFKSKDSKDGFATIGKKTIKI